MLDQYLPVPTQIPYTAKGITIAASTATLLGDATLASDLAVDVGVTVTIDPLGVGLDGEVGRF